jgi:hypothetical protein
VSLHTGRVAARDTVILGEEFIRCPVGIVATVSSAAFFAFIHITHNE